MHTFDGHVHWSYQVHHALSELWTALGHDKKNEIIILTCRGPYGVGEQYRVGGHAAFHAHDERHLQGLGEQA